MAQAVYSRSIMSEVTSAKPEGAGRRILRTGAAIVVVLLVAVYVWSIVSGRLQKDREIDAVVLALMALGAVVVAVLLAPGILERLSSLEMGGFKLELLKRVQEKQYQQESQLNDMQLLLPLLLPPAERLHLRNLFEKKTADYKGNYALRTEVRHLRTLDLIKMRGDRHVGELKDGTRFDLADSVQLTEFGKKWAERIQAIEAVETGEDAPGDGEKEDRN
jgi:hypothetical protein